MSETNDNEITGLETNENFKLCEDERFKGLDRHAAQTWIYPTNLPLRQYQYDIVQTALFHNTMVSLPTGLGKTMIAAVIIYNMYRWYPLGKIIFMAPTKPLVCQQADACRKITCIPSEHIVQLTGDVQKMSRGPIWEKTRVFFLTPQILQRDLQSKICPADLIRCIVFDEAHRARGNHAYCEVMRLLADNAARIRVLALSATPGATPVQVAEVAQILRIARLEVRTESSEDVKPYLFSKSVETVVVSLEEPLLSIKEEYIQILDYYTRRLMKSGVLTGSAANIHKGRIFMVLKEYKANCQRTGKRPDSTIVQDLTFCSTLYHAYELLIKHGLRGFLSFYDDHGGDKGWIRKNEQLTNLLNRVRDYLGPAELNTSMLPDGTIPEIDENVVFGHPKYYKLRDIVQKHFQENPDTRVMIFCEYRDSVQEAFAALLTCRPLIRPRMFLGQSAISQKQQLTVMAKFRKGECNTLICTCVAEEGLDVADVQLIICFDIANRSPVRLAQRMGRTGRHQTGRIVILVTEGREQQTLAETLQQSSLLDERLLRSPIVRGSMLPEGPPILPPDIQPQCLRLHMAPAELPPSDQDEKHKKLLEKIKKKMVVDEDVIWEGNLPSDDHIPVQTEKCLWKYSKNELENMTTSKRRKTLKYSASNFKEIDNSINLIKPSLDTQILNSLYKKCEDLKFNLPSSFRSTQNVPKTKNRDIRQMFGSNTQSQKDRNDFVIEIEEDKKDKVPKKSSQSVLPSKLVTKRNAFLLNLQSELNTRKTCEFLLEKKCSICDKRFDCTTLVKCMKTDEEHLPILPSIPIDNTFSYLSFEHLSKLHIKDMMADSNLQNYKTHFDFESYNCEVLFDKLRKSSNHMDNPVYFQDDTLNPVLTFHQKSIQRSSNIDDTTSGICLEDTTFSKSIRDDSMINAFFEKSFLTNDLNITTNHETNLSTNSRKSIQAVNANNLEISAVSVNDTKSFPKMFELSMYVPDEISKKALDFFGLTCLEDLFIENLEEPEEPVNQQNNKLLEKCGKMKENKNPSDFVDESASESEHEIINLCTPVEKSNDENCKKSQTQLEEPVNLNNTADITYKQKQLSSPIQINKKTSKFEKSENSFVFWDESLFLDDSDILMCNKNSENVQTSPVLCSQRQKPQNLNPQISPIISSQRQKPKYFDTKISPIISSQRIKTNASQNVMNSSKTSSTSPIISTQRLSLNNVSRKLSNIFSEMNFGDSKQTKDIDVNYISDEDLFADDKLDEFMLDSNTKPDLSNKENNIDSCSPKHSTKPKSIFQLKRPNSKKTENSPNSSLIHHQQNILLGSYDNSDSDDASLCDFVTPIKKKLKLELQKSSESPNSSKLNQINSSDITNSSTEISPIKILNNFKKSDQNTFDLSTFSFQSKKRFGNNDTTLLGHDDYKNSSREVLSPVEVRGKRKKKARCSFIDIEAEVSGEDETSDDDTDDNDGDLNTSFVNDNTELTQANVDMQALYLKSVKSPQNGKFKIPKLPNVRLEDICSQVDYNEESHYVQDSFVGETIVMNRELSILEIAEMELENRRRNIKKQKFNKKEKRKRIRKISESTSSDEDDEMKKLRNECLKNRSVFK